MVTRNYKAPEFNVQDSRSYSQTPVGPSDNRAATPLVVGDDAWRDQLLSSIGGKLANTFDKMADLEFSNAYLEGQAQAGVAASEEELQGNSLTKDWQIAGYRDTMGKLALADNEAQFLSDLPALSEKGSDGLEKYLAQRRQKLMPGIASMSREARATATGQMLLQDRSATKQWTDEHTKFIVGQKTQAIYTQWGVSLQALERTQVNAALGDGDIETMREQFRTTTGTVVGAVWGDTSLPQSAKKDVTFNMVQQALAKDNVALYDYMAANTLQDEEGSTMIGRLTGEQQLKLSNQYREAMSRTQGRRDVAQMTEVATMKSQIETGTYGGQSSDLEASLRSMVINKSMPLNEAEGIMQSFITKKYKSEVSSTLTTAALRNDQQAIANSGHTAAEGITAIEATMTSQNMGSDQRLGVWLGLGLKGNSKGFAKAGEILDGSIRQMMFSKELEVLPQHQQVFARINTELRAAETKGQTLARVNMLSGMSDDTRVYTERLLRSVDSGASLEEANANARDAAEQEKALTPAGRAARAASNATKAQALLEHIDSNNYIGQKWDQFIGWFSQESAADAVIRPKSEIGSRDNIFGDSDTVRFYVDQSRTAVRAELDNQLFLHPNLSPDSAIATAKAAVAGRTISTENGPLFMPRNTSAKELFGVGPANQAAVGKALDGILKTTKSTSRWQLRLDQGGVEAQEYSGSTRIGSARRIPPAEIIARIQEDTNKEHAVSNERMGSGRIRKASEVNPKSKAGLEQSGTTGRSKPDSTAAVQYNGINTAGVPTDWMFGFRDNLVASEGIVTKEAPDLSGQVLKNGQPIMTVGVGVSSHNPRYPKVDKDGNISAEALNTSFIEASNDAAVAGIRAAQDYGVRNKAGFQLMSELAYQSGPRFAHTANGKTGEAYRAFANLLSGTNVAEAKAAFTQTAAWASSGSKKHPDKVTDRQAKYLQLIEQSMRG